MIKTQDEIRKEVKRLIPRQNDVADGLDIDRTYFSKWMNNKITFSSEKLDRVIEWVNARS